MTLYLRMLKTILSSFFKPKMNSATMIIEDHFRVLPFDIDVYRHMNNAKYLNYMEAVRWGLMLRTGFLKASIKRGWIGPIAAMYIEYFRPLGLGQKFTLTTQFIHFEETRFFVLHRFWSKEKEVARAMVKGTVRKGRTNIPPGEYLGVLGLDSSKPEVDSEIQEWLKKYL